MRIASKAGFKIKLGLCRDTMNAASELGKGVVTHTIKATRNESNRDDDEYYDFVQDVPGTMTCGQTTHVLG